MVRDGEAELKLRPGCPAGLRAQTHHSGHGQQPENGLAAKPHFLQCNYSEAFDPKYNVLTPTGPNHKPSPPEYSQAVSLV